MSRLFFACWPDAGLGRALHRLAREEAAEHGGRVPAARNMHMTLVFLGEVDDRRVPGMMAAFAALRGEAFSLALNRLGGHRDLVWAAAAETPPALASLVDGLRTVAAAQEVVVEKRRFLPHVTLIRKARGIAGRDIVLPEWRVGAYTLESSRLTPAGPVYRRLARFGLEPGGA